MYSPGDVLSKQLKHREKSPEFFYESIEFFPRKGFNKKNYVLYRITHNYVLCSITHSVKKKLHHDENHL